MDQEVGGPAAEVQDSKLVVRCEEKEIEREFVIEIVVLAADGLGFVKLLTVVAAIEGRRRGTSLVFACSKH